MRFLPLFFRPLFLAFALVLLASCGKSDGPETPMTNKVEPNNRLPPPVTTTSKVDPVSGSTYAVKEGAYCKMGADGNYVSSTSVIAEKGSNGENYFAKGGGCLFKNIRDAWAVSHNPNFSKWRDATTESIEALPTADTTFLFESHYSAGPFFAKQKWDMDWFHILKAGSLEAPESILINYKKIRGTKHIENWQGSIQIDKLTTSVTSYVMYNEIRGTQINESSAKGGAEDLFNNALTLTPNWQYLNP